MSIPTLFLYKLSICPLLYNVLSSNKIFFNNNRKHVVWICIILMCFYALYWLMLKKGKISTKKKERSEHLCDYVSTTIYCCIIKFQIVMHSCTTVRPHFIGYTYTVLEFDVYDQQKNRKIVKKKKKKIIFFVRLCPPDGDIGSLFELPVCTLQCGLSTPDTGSETKHRVSCAFTDPLISL